MHVFNAWWYQSLTAACSLAHKPPQPARSWCRPHMVGLLPSRSAVALPCCSNCRRAVRLPRVRASSSDEPRPIGCSDLYNMTDAINAQLQQPEAPRDVGSSRIQDDGLATLSTSSSSSSSSSGSSSNSTPLAAEGRPSAPQQQQQQQQANSAAAAAAAAAAARQGAAYYSGLLTSDLRQDNAASSGDMLQRSLQLAGGVAVLLGGLLLAFLASNGLLG